MDYYFKSIVSMSHLIGSVTGILTDYFTGIFDKDFIKVIWNTKEEPYNQRNKAFRNTMIKPRPILIIDPRFDPSEDADFRPMSEFDSEVYNEPEMCFRYGHGVPLVRHPNFELYFIPRRFKMNFSMSMIFDSDIQRIQCQQYVRQTVRHRIPIIVSHYIENVIPNSFIKAISLLNDKKISDIEEWINKYTENPIRYRYRTGSGNDEFFATIESPIQMTFSEGPSSNGPVKKGNIVVSSSFSEDVSVEFVAPSIYYLRTKDHVEVDSDSEFNIDDKINFVAVNNVAVKDIQCGPNEISTFTKYKSVTVQPDVNGTDSINIHDLITDTDITNVMRYYLANNMKIDFINSLVFEDVNSVNADRLSYNTTTGMLTIRDMTIYKTYRIEIYVDRNIVGGVIDKIYLTNDKYSEEYK